MFEKKAVFSWTEPFRKDGALKAALGACSKSLK